jgi:hypothetical protein
VADELQAAARLPTPDARPSRSRSSGENYQVSDQNVMIKKQHAV